MSTVLELNSAILGVKSRLRTTLDQASALPKTSLLRCSLGMDVQTLESQLRALYQQRAFAEHGEMAAYPRQPEPTPVRSPRAVRPLRQAVRVRPPVVQFIPAPSAQTLPLPTVPRAQRDDAIIGYEVVWTPHRDAPSLIGSYGRRSAR